MRTLGFNMAFPGLLLMRGGFKPSLGGRLGNLTWANFESELLTSATNEGHLATYNDFVDYIFFNAAAFNLADNDALDTALTNETMTLANMDIYAGDYTP